MSRWKAKGKLNTTTQPHIHCFVISSCRLARSSTTSGHHFNNWDVLTFSTRSFIFPWKYCANTWPFPTTKFFMMQEMIIQHYTLGLAALELPKPVLPLGLNPGMSNCTRTVTGALQWSIGFEIRVSGVWDSATTRIDSSARWTPPQPRRTHISCTTTRCVAYQVESSTYRIKHAKACKGKKARKCEHVFASQGKLAEVLAGPATAVPLILLNDPRRDFYCGRRLVDIVPSREASGQPPRRYVALSHVWSDGLGNPQENGIPICQFRRLGKLVARLYGVQWPEDSASMAIWFDTLCFPLGPEEAYTTALIRMRQSYEEAERVSVLDEYLLQLRVRNIGDEVEAVSRILISPWNTRLWTFQEARLAPEKSLYFCVKNGFVGEEGCVLGLRSIVGRNRVLEKGWLDMPASHRLLLEGFHEEY